MKHKIYKLDKNQRFRLETVLDIIMTLNYSNASSSSDEELCIDSTFNNNSSDSENSNKLKEIIPPSPKRCRKYSTRNINKQLSNQVLVDVNILEFGTHQTLDTTDTQNIQPISTRTIETSQTMSTQHDHDHDDVQISTSCEQIVTIQVEKKNTTVDSQHTQILELVMNSPNSLKLLVIDSQLQSSVGPNTEPVITIELEAPEEIP